MYLVAVDSATLWPMRACPPKDLIRSVRASDSLLRAGVDEWRRRRFVPGN